MTALAITLVDDMQCRLGCGACCIAISISSAIPGMPAGKRAGLRCIQLTDANLCALFGLPERPEICGRLRPGIAMCGEDREHALAFLGDLETASAPD